jgi:Domain of unknown function (DUF4157)/Putative peptidoglycan binding domain
MREPFSVTCLVAHAHGSAKSDEHVTIRWTRLRIAPRTNRYHSHEPAGSERRGLRCAFSSKLYGGTKIETILVLIIDRMKQQQIARRDAVTSGLANLFAPKASYRSRPTGRRFLGPQEGGGNHSFLRRFGTGFQGKLTINQPNDQFELEADRVADQVMRMPAGAFDGSGAALGLSNHGLQRKCACGGTPGPTGECDACRKKRLSLQRRSANSHGPTDAPPIVHEVLRSPGQPLDRHTRAFMESRFGHAFSPAPLRAAPAAQTKLVVGEAGDQFEQQADRMAETVMQMPEPRTVSKSRPRGVADFSHVRLHTGARAAESARTVNAKAYTVGHEVVFGEGHYRPETSEGRKLLAHELAHTVQQASTESRAIAQLQRTIGDGHDLTSARFAGDSVLEACFDNERTLRVGSRGEAVEKIQQALIDAGFPLPRFGADGDFGSETQTALQSFQGANGLEADGVLGPSTMGSLDVQFATEPIPPAPQNQELTEKELVALRPVAQTPDGNALGPTNPALRGCLGQRFFFSGSVVNTTTAANGISAVTAQLREPPAEAAPCSCGCGLFRQFIRGFWRAGSATAAKRFDITSCGNTITMNETTFTEEFVNCVTANAPISASCSRAQADAPGWQSGLTNGTFVQMHLVLRYQMWDQCRSRSLGQADHVLDISGSNSPRTVTFT